MQAAKSYNVLLVEDEGLIARDIAQRVEALGHKVADTVSTGEEAVESAAGMDVVLMDIRLDGKLDGIQAAHSIRQRHHVPVIFLTAHADRSTLERAKRAEPFGYIVKPVAPAALHTSIEVAVYKNAMDRELADREEWLRAVLGASADAVAVANLEGQVRILNPAAEALTGWSAAEAEGQELAKIVALATESADAVESPVPLAMLRDAAVPLGRKTQLVTRGGRKVPIEGSAAPVRLGERTIGVVLNFRDISQRRWEEQQLRQAQQMEVGARLAAGIAEEYTSLLAVIRGQAERLLDLFGDYSPARQSAEEIRHAASAAEQVRRRLVGLARRQPVHPKILSLNGVLRRMTKLLETVAGEGVSVTVRPGAQASKIKADEAQMEQLLINATLHAGRMCPRGGEIRIETGPSEREVEGTPGGYIRIAITHPVAAATDADHRFDPASATEESLSLLLAHSIVSEHNGFFSAHRTADGNACLEVLLPRWAEEDAPGPAILPASTHTILLVEARETVRAELHKFFEKNGLNLLEAGDAGEAIALAEVREGPLDMLIAPSPEAERIQKALRESRPELAVLRIVDAQERTAGELRRPYTQAALLARVRALVEKDLPDQLVTAAGTF